MKCEVCLDLLEEYLDGELAPDDRGQVGAHLITCPDCASEFAALSAEQEIFARYDRELEVSPALWATVSERTAPAAAMIVPAIRNGWRIRIAGLFVVHSPSLAGAIAIVLLAITLGAVYLFARRPAPQITAEDSNHKRETDTPNRAVDELLVKEEGDTAKELKRRPATSQSKRRMTPAAKVATIDHSDVLSSDLGYMDMDDRDTAKHIEQSQNLLRSIRNFPVSEGEEEIDVTYDKALSRRLLNENVVLRREAEMKARFPTKTLLADLEPFLIDIANLPDHARPDEVRVIKERVQKTEIVAALLDYQDRGTNNR